MDRMVSFVFARAMNRALCLLAPLCALGCFDVETVDPGSEVEPFLVDDFESANQLPQPPFQLWACRAFMPNDDQSGVEACNFENAGNGSPTSFMGQFALRDRPNGLAEYEGASLSASTTRALDLRRYRELSVSVKFTSDQVIGNALNNLYIELTCRSARVEGALGNPATEVPSVVRQIVLGGNAWFTFRIPLSRFNQPQWQLDLIQGGPNACLARIDSLAFVLSTDVGDGATGRASLYIDDVSFE